MAEEKKEAPVKDNVPEEKKVERVFPRTLYKPGGKIDAGRGIFYSDIVVVNEEERTAAMKNGWLDSFKKAIDKAKAEAKAKE